MVNEKKNILILLDWYLPGFKAGGPIQSISNLIELLKDKFNFKIITRDRDFNSIKPYEGIKIDEWTKNDSCEIYYISPNNLNNKNLLYLIKSSKCDLVYLNSLFSLKFSIWPLIWNREKKIKAKVLISPRGMLGNGALSIKPFKKKIFLFFSKLFGLYNEISWHATSSEEEKDIKKNISNNANCILISNVPRKQDSFKPIKKSSGILKICFISRITEKKNLLYGIQILNNVNYGKVFFDVYGPIENKKYWEKCIEESKKLSENIIFNYKGELSPNEINNTLSDYHAFFLPTLDENYGHAIVETFQAGRIAVISDQTPWKNLINQKIGFDIPLTEKNEFTKAISLLIKLNQDEFDSFSFNSFNFIRNKISLKSIEENYSTRFNLLINK